MNTMNSELEAQLASQRKKASITSLVIGILCMCLMTLIFWLIGIKVFSKKTEAMVVYSSGDETEEIIEKTKVSNSVKKMPAARSSTAVQVVSAQAVSNFAIPVPEILLDTTSVDFGDDEGFGSGWGSGVGDGSGGGGFSFMGSKMSADRVCFVIDYSSSMVGNRIKLLKAELKKTLDGFPNGIDYQIIFFAGPAWVAGSSVDSSSRAAKISHNGTTYNWTGNGAFNWSPSGARQPVTWVRSSAATRAASLKTVNDTGLVYGTSWSSPLEMAFGMEPKPNLVIFLTDGSSGNDSLQKAQLLGDKARARQIRVNTIALMEPRAKDAMRALATKTGGSFVMIDETGQKAPQ